MEDRKIALSSMIVSIMAIMLVALSIAVAMQPGPEGPQGERGPRGIPGEDGEDGERGPRGYSGEDGEDGKDGKGMDGSWHHITATSGVDDDDIYFNVEGNAIRLFIIGHTYSSYPVLTVNLYEQGESNIYIASHAANDYYFTSSGYDSWNECIICEPGNYRLSINAANLDEWVLRIEEWK